MTSCADDDIVACMIRAVAAGLARDLDEDRVFYKLHTQLRLTSCADNDIVACMIRAVAIAVLTAGGALYPLATQTPARIPGCLYEDARSRV